MDHLFTPEDYIAIACQVKSELRRRMRGLRAALSSETRDEKSVLVVESLARHEVFAGVRTVGLYAPMVHRCELDIDPLFAILRQRGIDVAYPRVLEDGGLAFHFANPRTMRARESRPSTPSSFRPLGRIYREIAWDTGEGPTTGRWHRSPSGHAPLRFSTTSKYSWRFHNLLPTCPSIGFSPTGAFFTAGLRRFKKFPG